MGFFDKFKHNEQQNSDEPIVIPDVPQNTVSQTGGILNLQKNDLLNLSKGLSKVRVSAGWDVVTFGRDYDLDLCCMTQTESGAIQDCIYYGHQQGRGIFLDGDNRTGEDTNETGDDENIYVDLDKINSSISKLIFCVVIYQAQNREQQFENVKNAFVRLVDVGNNYKNEICRYNLSEDGRDNTAVVFASLNRTDSGWQFQAIGNYTKASIKQLNSRLAGK